MDETVFNRPVDGSDSRNPRSFYVQLVDNVRDVDGVADFITLVNTLDADDLELALPSLCLLAPQTLAQSHAAALRRVCADVLNDVNSTRPGRRSVLACLKALPLQKLGSRELWNNFYVLMECLEEPQFHIVLPVLPKMASLLEAVRKDDGSFDWIFVRAVLVRSFLHSNGWIRNWGVQKAVEVDVVVLAKHFEFVTDCLLPALDSNDAFWRFLEKSNLTDFFAKFECLFGRILECLRQEERVVFIRRFLHAILHLACPTTQYFVSTVERFLPRFSLCDSADDLSLFEQIMSRVRRMSYRAMRVVTVWNMVRFFAKIANFSALEMSDGFPQILAHFAAETGDAKGLSFDVSKVEVADGEASEASTDVMALKAIRRFQTHPENFVEYTLLFWEQAKLLGDDAANKLSLFLTQRLYDLLYEEAVDGDDVDVTCKKELPAILELKMHAPESLETKAVSGLHKLQNAHKDIEKGELVDVARDLGGKTMMWLVTASGASMDCDLATRTYLPYLVQFYPELADVLPATFFEMIKQGIACLRGAPEIIQSAYFLLCVVRSLEARNVFGFDGPSAKIRSLAAMFWDVYEQRPPNSLLRMPPVNRKDGRRSDASGGSLGASAHQKELNEAVSRLHSLWLKLFWWAKCTLGYKSLPARELLEECVEQLDVASSFAVKEQLLNIIADVILDAENLELTAIVDVVERTIRACAEVVSEEKKSLNSLPALEKLVSVGFAALRIDDDRICQLVEDQMEKQMSISSQNVQVPFVILDNLHFANLRLWPKFHSRLMVRLALFGPVPKKDARVLSAFYEKIFTSSEIAPVLEKGGRRERLDQIVQLTRFGAVLMILDTLRRTPRSDVDAYLGVFQELFDAVEEIDKTSSRSFGLSLAHRQKTRAVSLLFFVSSLLPELGVDDDVDLDDGASLLARVYDFCVACLLDPCQQFSIKLVVEANVAWLGLVYPSVFRRFSAIDKWMAQQRIGSVTSWINVMTLISRAEPGKAKECLEKVVPWTSAQNFPVRCTAIAACRLMFGYLEPTSKAEFRLVEAIIGFDAEPAGNSRRVVDNLCADFFFAKLDVRRHFAFQTIFVEIPRKTGMPPEETIPVHVMQVYQEAKDWMEKNFASDVAPFDIACADDEFVNAPYNVFSGLAKNTSCAPDMQELDGGDSVVGTSSTEVVEDLAGGEAENPFQRKIVKEDVVRRDDCSLILVASLVDKPNNLGGICRTCEIFGVDKLVIADPLMALDSNFKALSLSSENWQPIEAVKPENLLPYLESLRADGYSVVAAEQTTDSVRMHKFKFPKKCVVVLGAEKEGVPVELLRAVDTAVEIDQLGHTRSLNVHVTAALFVSKYVEQNVLASEATAVAPLRQ